jgi:hypothetical protein
VLLTGLQRGTHRSIRGRLRSPGSEHDSGRLTQALQRQQISVRARNLRLCCSRATYCDLWDLSHSFDRSAGLKENAIRSTWQFPSPPAVATAKAGFVVPPSSPPHMKAKQQSKPPGSGAVKKKKKRGNSGSHDDQRLGSEEQQIGHVNWSSTLRNDVWGDEMTRYVGINPKHSSGEDWRSPRLQTGNPKVHPPDSLVPGASGSTPTTQTNTGVDASASTVDASAR